MIRILTGPELCRGQVLGQNWNLRQPLRQSRLGGTEVWVACNGYTDTQIGVLYLAGCDPRDGTVLRPAQLGAIRHVQALDLLKGHPLVPNVLQTFTHNGRYGFVREYIWGPTLEAVVRQQGPIPWKLVARFALHLAHLIEDQRRNGIDCRDIKPANVLISSGHARLCDYSAAGGPMLPFGSEWGCAAIGTPGFSPPEQLLIGSEPVYGGDVWALMATIYFMLTGHGPFLKPGESPKRVPGMELIMRAEQHNFAIQPLPANVPESLSALVMLVLGRPLADCPGTGVIIRQLNQALGLNPMAN